MKSRIPEPRNCVLTFYYHNDIRPIGNSDKCVSYKKLHAETCYGGRIVVETREKCDGL